MFRCGQGGDQEKFKEITRAYEVGAGRSGRGDWMRLVLAGGVDGWVSSERAEEGMALRKG